MIAVDIYLFYNYIGVCGKDRLKINGQNFVRVSGQDDQTISHKGACQLVGHDVSTKPEVSLPKVAWNHADLASGKFSHPWEENLIFAW